MKISELGEFQMIQRFSPMFLRNLPLHIQGIGDDCAVIPQSEHSSLLVTTDMLVENVHFLQHMISANDLGYKSLAVNISDIAAMGGSPTFAFMSVALPIDIAVSWVDDFFAGFHQLAQEKSISLLGGDLTKSLTDIVVNVTLLGTINTPFIKLRSSAKPNDIICVTDFLGNSAAGLQSIFQGIEKTKDVEYLLMHHYRPQTYIEEGMFLSRQQGVHAMMDVSDGISSDLKHILQRSFCSAEIDVDRLPLSKPYQNICQKFGWDSPSLALSGGEDYCLLVTIDAVHFSQIATSYLQTFQRPLYPIGRITNACQEPTISYFWNAKPFSLQKTGFDHFRL